jgi:DNA-binding NarL/FixJ family response regulator
MTNRLLLVDDHDLVRESIRLALSGLPDLEVVGEASNGLQAVEAASRLRPDVVLMDLAMPVLDGVDATRLLLASDPSVRIVVWTTAARGGALELAALEAGAVSVVYKDAPVGTVLEAIRSAVEVSSI